MQLSRTIYAQSKPAIEPSPTPHTTSSPDYAGPPTVKTEQVVLQPFQRAGERKTPPARCDHTNATAVDMKHVALAPRNFPLQFVD
ncbi:hypothetical protein CG716_25350 [Mycolicibacterium sphagni]|uniref:Uncharacterized protein n=1 Tax=Mycolicibacterium sphagni TaxID=1786 RepID=A0A255D8X8_9MYCO|nr:hypothetical protein CG716_25350 [Mycolicibacterium sphagni]